MDRKGYSSSSTSSPAIRGGGGGGGGSVYPVPAPAATYQQMPPYTRRTSWLIPLFVVANVIVFVITMVVNNCPHHTSICVLPFLKRVSFESFHQNPLLGPSSDTLLKMGALDSRKIVQHHQGWRLISCMWLHAGVIHLVANMVSLLFIGIRLEKEFGFIKVGLLYLLSGLGGSILSAMFIQDRISVGASGALFGLLGGMLSELLTNWTLYSNKLASLITLIIIIVINLAVGILPFVDNFAHIGGFVSGFLLGFVLLIKPQLGWSGNYDGALVGPGPPVKSKHKHYQYIFWIVALVLLIAGYTACLVLLFKGVDVNKKCSWCHYLSCVPSKHWKCSPRILCHYSYPKGFLTVSCDGTPFSWDWPDVSDAGGDEQYCKASCSGLK